MHLSVHQKVIHQSFDHPQPSWGESDQVGTGEMFLHLNLVDRLEIRQQQKQIQHHLLKIDAATGVRVIQPERPGQLLIVGSLPADAHRQQPLPDNVRLSLGQKQ